MRLIFACPARLSTDYIDLYQLHGGTIQDNIDETIEAFESLKQQGKIRYYGISSIRPNVIREYIKRRARLLQVIRLGWALVPIAIILSFRQWARQYGLYLVGFAYLTMLAVSWWIARQTKCPRCAGSLRQFTRAVPTRRFGLSDSCPHCGVNLDEHI